ncbi:MAG: PHP domain-containing protein [Lentisphaerae bacterium]|nr:PHP domain-containing protein [Lentisphaerota bacterium]
MDYIDLHTHSNASDGTFSPSEVYSLALELNLTAIALTDHDTTDGLEEFMNAGKEHPECEAVPGVEIACQLADKEIHIVGLFIDRRSKVLQELLDFCRSERMKRNRDIFLKLHFLGYDLDISMPEFGGKNLLEIGRPHFARALVRHYGFPSMQSGFDRLLGHGKPAWVKRKYPLPETVIQAIHLAGGVAVWAHPITRDVPDRAFLMRSCRRLKSMGLDAIEGYYSMFSARETALISEAAAHHGLLLSGGSDFHGDNRPNTLLAFGSGGLRIPEELFFKLKNSNCRDLNS